MQPVEVEHLPTGHRRRHLKPVGSPATAGSCTTPRAWRGRGNRAGPRPVVVAQALRPEYVLRRLYQLTTDAALTDAEHRLSTAQDHSAITSAERAAVEVRGAQES